MSDIRDNSHPVKGLALPWGQLRRLTAERAPLRLLIVAAAVLVLMSVLNPGRFLTAHNFSSMCFQFPELGIFAIAVALSLISGGIDLSVISVANLTGILAASILTRASAGEVSSPVVVGCIGLAIAAALLTSAACGLINGLLISRFGIPPILATLGTMQLFVGISLVITRGHAIAGYPEAAQMIGNGTLAGIPVPLLLFLVLACLVQVALTRTRFGVSMCLMGTNPTAARFSGLDISGLSLRTYVITALLAGVAGLIIISRTNSAKADYGSSYLLQAVLVAILGGVNPRGGFGSVWGILLAVLSLQFLSSGLNMLQLNETVGPYINNFAREFTWGALLLVVMAVNYYSTRAQSTPR